MDDCVVDWAWRAWGDAHMIKRFNARKRIFVEIQWGQRKGSIGFVRRDDFKVASSKNLMIKTRGYIHIQFDGERYSYAVRADGLVAYNLMPLHGDHTTRHIKRALNKAPTCFSDRHGNLVAVGDAILAGASDGLTFGEVLKIGTDRVTIRANGQIRKLLLKRPDGKFGFNIVKLTPKMHEGFFLEKLSTVSD